MTNIGMTLLTGLLLVGLWVNAPDTGTNEVKAEDGSCVTEDFYE